MLIVLIYFAIIVVISAKSKTDVDSIRGLPLLLQRLAESSSNKQSPFLFKGCDKANSFFGSAFLPINSKEMGHYYDYSWTVHGHEYSVSFEKHLDYNAMHCISGSDRIKIHSDDVNYILANAPKVAQDMFNQGLIDSFTKSKIVALFTTIKNPSKLLNNKLYVSLQKFLSNLQKVEFKVLKYLSDAYQNRIVEETTKVFSENNLTVGAIWNEIKASILRQLKLVGLRVDISTHSKNYMTINGFLQPLIDSFYTKYLALDGNGAFKIEDSRTIKAFIIKLKKALGGDVSNKMVSESELQNKITAIEQQVSSGDVLDRIVSK